MGKLVTVTDFIFLGSKITAEGDCSHEIKRRLFLGRKVMINLDSILKSRSITLSTKVHLVKAMVFPVVMYGCESWTLKIAERRRINAFELWCWRRLLRFPWKKSYDQSRQLIKKQRHYFANKGPSKSKLCFYQLSFMDVRVGLYGKLNA